METEVLRFRQAHNIRMLGEFRFGAWLNDKRTNLITGISAKFHQNRPIKLIFKPFKAKLLEP